MEMGLPKIKDEYEEYVGKEVRMTSKSGPLLGVLLKIDHRSENYSLKPSLIPINIPESKGVWREQYYLNKKTPTKVKKTLIEIVQELPEGYLSAIVNNINTINNKDTQDTLSKERISLKERIKIAYNILTKKIKIPKN